MKHKGLHTRRLRDNPEEKRFAEAWNKANEQGQLLDWLLDRRAVQTGRPSEALNADIVTAATVIQWLGSPVGQAWLRDLGYEKKGE